MTRCAWLSLLLVFVVLGCSTRPGDPPPPASARVPIGDGCLVTLATDKPRYAPGETVHIRALLLKPDTLAPDLRPLRVSVTVLDSQGRLGRILVAIAQDGVAACDWATTGQAGGDYRIQAETIGTPSTRAERGIVLAGYRPTPFALAADCARTSHARGETATVAISLRAHDGRPAPTAVLRASVAFAGAARALAVPTLDAQGAALIQVPIPADAIGDGALTITADDGASLATITRALPLSVPAPRLTWTAGGGALVAGLPNALYLQASDDAGRPVALSGRIVDDTDTTLATITTTHEGRGRCDLTPRAGGRYRLVIAGGDFPLPSPVPDGITLQLARTRIPAGESLRLTATSTRAGDHRVIVRRRGLIVGELACALAAMQPTPLSISLDGDAPGVVVVSVTGADGRVVAETLAYHEPARRLAVRVVADRARYQPGDTATLTISARDERGLPAQALVGLAVTDAGVTSLLSTREQPPTLPAMALLENEVERFADAARYLTGDAAGDDALDLLLGAQGWRLLMTDPAAVARHHRHCLLPPPADDGWPLMLAALPGQPRPALAADGPEPSGAHEPPQMNPPPAPLGRDGAKVDTGLRWLKLHQGPDGAWPAAVDPVTARISAWREPEATRATTALAVLAFLGAGYDHRTPNKYKATVGAGLAWLIGQASDGRFSADPSVQGLCLCSIAEAYAMTNDPALRRTCDQAVAALLAQQVRHEGQLLGWPARGDDAPVCDADASLNAVMGLKSALVGGLAIGDGMQGAKHYLNAAWRAANGPTPGARSTFPTRWDPRTNQCWQPHQPAAGLLMAVFLGHNSSDPLLVSLGEHVFSRHLPLAPPYSPLLLQQATIGIFQVGGVNWTLWNQITRELLISKQRGEGTGDRVGSWDPADFDVAARRFGRTATSALVMLTLEVYYRYKAVAPRGIPGDGGDPLPVPRTLVWEPRLRIGADGTVSVRVPLGNNAATFRANIDAIDDRGALGAESTTLVVASELELLAQWPERLTSEDRAEVLLTVRDHRQPPASEAVVSADGRNPRTVALKDGIGRLRWPLGPLMAGTWITNLRAVTGDERRADATHRWLVPEALFPWKAGANGTLGDAAGVTARVDVPAATRVETLKAKLVLYPSASAHLTAASAALITEPHGCFEQVGATTFPLALAAKRFAKSDAVDDAQRQRTHAMLSDGAQRLLGYACPSGGFSWWGQDPGHPLLTAHGLMLLHELSTTVTVDAMQVATARTWLLAQRGADGRFVQPAGAWHSPYADAYILWALLECDSHDADLLASSIALVAAQAEQDDDPYRLALTALVLDRAGQRERAARLVARLAQDGRGALSGVRRGLLGEGAAAEVEATALALMCWQNDDEATLRRARAASDFLFSRCRDGAFDSTLATVLALRALSDAERWNAPPAARFEVRVRVDNREDVLLTMPANSNAPLVLNLDRQLASHGEHSLRLISDGTHFVPWTLVLSGQRAQPEDRPDAPTIRVRLAAERATVGEVVMLHASCTSGARATQSPLAVIPLPGGLDPDPTGMRALVATGRLAAWEWRGGALVCYWDRWEAGATHELAIPCIAAVPGHFRAPPARCQPYYEYEHTGWCAGTAITIDTPLGW